MPQNHVQEWSILDSSGNYLPGIGYSPGAMQKFSEEAFDLRSVNRVRF